MQIRSGLVSYELDNSEERWFGILKNVLLMFFSWLDRDRGFSGGRPQR